MDTDPTILPLTGGTLEIENAVNSILGESAISNDTDESNFGTVALLHDDVDTRKKIESKMCEK